MVRLIGRMMSGPDFSGFLEKASRKMQIARAHHRESQLANFALRLVVKFEELILDRKSKTG
jgi:hypothetical protein